MKALLLLASLTLLPTAAHAADPIPSLCRVFTESSPRIWDKNLGQVDGPGGSAAEDQRYLLVDAARTSARSISHDYLKGERERDGFKQLDGSVLVTFQQTSLDSYLISIEEIEAGKKWEDQTYNWALGSVTEKSGVALFSPRAKVYADCVPKKKKDAGPGLLQPLE